MLDEFNVGLPGGFPDHPHRGFETVTYVLPTSKGHMCHEDFLGNKGELRPGDLQWMTPGRGIMHAEMPKSEVPAHGLQLWINLPSKSRMVEPKYQEISRDTVPHAFNEDKSIEAIVFAGELSVRALEFSHSLPAHVFMDLTTWSSPPTQSNSFLLFSDRKSTTLKLSQDFCAGGGSFAQSTTTTTSSLKSIAKKMFTPRTIAKKFVAREQGEGAGARVHRSIGTTRLRNLDPFLMLDEFNVGLPGGFPDHPHRGFETVTCQVIDYG
eukprot:jgi/Phyca11/15274/fgenesh1_pg.PHYCAscaffold_12_\